MKVWMTCEHLVEVTVPNVTILEIRRNLKALGAEVLLFCPSTDKGKGFAEEEAIYFVPTVHNRWLRGLLYQFSLMPCMLLLSLRSRPDWIYTRPHLTMITPALVAGLLRKPHILHPSGDLIDQMKRANASPLLRFLYLLVEKANCKLSKRVVVETQQIKQIYERRHHLSPQKVVAIPNGANTELFVPKPIHEAQQAIGIDPSALWVGFIGNLLEEEGIQYLIEAAPLVRSQVPDARFLIVGDGPYKSELLDLAKRSSAHDSFVFVGRVPYEDVPTYIASMDVCVVPRNKSQHEATGISSLKLREYMACGKPVVGSDILGVGDVLREAEAGIAVTPEITPEFAEVILGLLRDDTLREEMGRKGRAFVQDNLSWHATTRKIVEAWGGHVGKK